MRTSISPMLLTLAAVLCAAETGFAYGQGRADSWQARHSPAAPLQMAYMDEMYDDRQDAEDLPGMGRRRPQAYAGDQPCGHGAYHGGGGGHCGGHCGGCGGGHCGGCGGGCAPGGGGWCDDGYWCDPGYWCDDVCAGGYGGAHRAPCRHRGRPGGVLASGMCYAEVQTMFLRANVSEQAVGRLSERYEYSPRYIIGCELPSGLGIRARYWWYDEVTENVDLPADSLRLELDVLDIEATHRFRTTRSDLVVSGGVRWARLLAGTRDLEFGAPDLVARSDNMLGLTFAADARTGICIHGQCEWALVGGGRWSMLTGDWDSQVFNPIVAPWHDDNVFVNEVYAGLECVYSGRGCNFYARAAFEMQNWRSDAMSSTNAGTLSFFGPAIHAGITY